MLDAFRLFLFLHVLGAIVAFGFGFAAPVIGKMAAAQLQHAPFFIRAVKRVSETVIIPAALSMAVTGILLIATGSRSPQEAWLALSIVIYVVALGLVFLVQRPLFLELIELTSSPPGPGGPNPRIPLLARRLRNLGLVLTGLVTVIVFLMTVKPAI